MTASTLLDLFTQHNAVWLIAASVFSLLVGSFLNVLILRLPKAMQAELSLIYISEPTRPY